jgi:hypothetical protein
MRGGIRTELSPHHGWLLVRLKIRQAAGPQRWQVVNARLTLTKAAGGLHWAIACSSQKMGFLCLPHLLPITACGRYLNIDGKAAFLDCYRRLSFIFKADLKILPALHSSPPKPGRSSKNPRFLHLARVARIVSIGSFVFL